MSQACAGIGYAHRAGVIHCDVKPQNILVTPDKRLKVVDFGIARALSTITPDEQAEIVWGSPNYFSPEQASGSAPSPASDVYSLGVVMYEMLAGQLPFKADTSQELARLHREALPPPLRKYNPNIPNSLEDIVLKALSKDPTARFRTAGQLGRELVAFKQQSNKQNITPSSQIGGTSPYPPTGMTSSQTVLVTNQRYDSVVTSSNHEQHLRQPASLLDDAQIQLDNRLNFDWTIWILGLLVLIALGGLIPFWLWVYYTLNTPLGG
jgi:serine/threonine-protein kinase